MTTQTLENNILNISNGIKLLNCDSGNDNDVDYDFFDSVDLKSSEQAEPKNCIKENKKTISTKVETNRVSFAKTKISSDIPATKELMNCIAYESVSPDAGIPDCVKNSRLADSPDSFSSDTTSDFTEVTPRASSSGCSSLSKCDMKNKCASPRNCPNPGKCNDPPPDKVEQDRPFKFLKEALDCLEAENRSVSSHGLEKKCNVIHKNMTFTKDELRKIERENQILLRKIEDNFRQKPKYLPTAVTYRRLSSSAINRQRQQKRIEHDNLVRFIIVIILDMS